MMLVCASVRECLLSGDEEPPGGHKLRGLAYSESDPRPVQIPTVSESPRSSLKR